MTDTTQIDIINNTTTIKTIDEKPIECSQRGELPIHTLVHPFSNKSEDGIPMVQALYRAY